MIDFKIKVDDTRIGVMFDELPRRLRANLKRTITELTDELLLKVRAGEPRRTGALRAETRRFIDERENFIRGRVRILGPGGRGHNIAAAALEYGAHRPVAVKSYTRGGSRVGAYRRTANITERRFLRNPADAMRPKVLAELQRAIDQTIAEMNRR